ncbi:MAG: macro domain-containing protein [Hyphomicrobiales bacterium]
MKVTIFDKQVRDSFSKIAAGIGAALSTLLLFVSIPDDCKLYSLFGLALVLFIIYLVIWWHANSLKEVVIKIDGTTVTVKSGDIFNEEGLKAIAFNEYFDTVVDNILISERSLNGIFLSSKLNGTIPELDAEIERYPFEEGEILQQEAPRTDGKKVKFRLGTIFVKDDFLLTAMSKFDTSNRANLTMPEYLEFLINFWDRVNKVYAQRSVVTPIFGSGITRIRGHRNISDEDLLKIMLWTFRISEMRFKYPAKLTIVVHTSKIDQVNLLDLKSLRNGV